MNPENNFNPTMIIRQHKFITPEGEVDAIFYEQEDGKFILSFFKNLEVIKEDDITDMWLASKSIFEIDEFMRDAIRRCIWL